MAIIRFILGVLQWLIIIVITMLGVYVLSSNFNIFGGYHPFLVQSGSMEPAIMTGDVIVIHSKSTYSLNDVITFRDGSDHIVTHRIIAVDRDQEKMFTTKGDANRSGDEDLISNEQVIGKVALVIPRLGYIVAFVKSTSGILYLLILPAIIFILDELVKIKKYVKASN